MTRDMLAAAGLAAALVAPGITASASNEWDTYPCPTGVLRADQTVVVPDGGVELPGEIACGVPEPGPQFAVGVFEVGATSGYINDGLLHYYDSPSGPTRFTLFGYRVAEEFTEAAVCLMTDKKTRLSCVHVSSDLVVEQMSTSDSMVTKPLRMEFGEDSPNCATCWRIMP